MAAAGEPARGGGAGRPAVPAARAMRAGAVAMVVLIVLFAQIGWPAGSPADVPDFAQMALYDRVIWSLKSNWLAQVLALGAMATWFASLAVERRAEKRARR
ncbi:MAG: hypothetical protein JNK11_03965 [Alphaproteobacteria bacterium]|nr:hypothetical protein [Alphaproteobacteria bacterium]